MNRNEAAKYLAETVASYLDDGFPLIHLTGETSNGRPDQVHLNKLAQALKTLGQEDAAKLVINNQCKRPLV